MPEEKDVKGSPSEPSALEEAIASSPEAEPQAPETETTTPQKVETQEPEERVPYDRFKDVVDEKNYWRDIAIRQQNQQPQQPAPQNPYQGMSPEEERFWRAVDERAAKIADEKFKNVSPILDAGRMELAQLKVQQFRASHSDIKPNSPEEIAIAEKISAGYMPDDAYWAVMGPRGQRQAESAATKRLKQQIEDKKKANVEQKSLPSSSLPPQDTKKMPLRQRLERDWERLERGEEI